MQYVSTGHAVAGVWERERESSYLAEGEGVVLDLCGETRAHASTAEGKYESQLVFPEVAREGVGKLTRQVAETSG